MTDRSTDSTSLLSRLRTDGIEHFWVIYHDYGGRAEAKTLPPESFESAATGGVVFAMANLNMAADDSQALGASLLANSGDFLALPDPRSYAVLPRYPKTARCHAWMRATDGSVWDGCPRTRLNTAVDDLRDLGYSVQAALEPEFYLLTPGEHGDYLPANHHQDVQPGRARRRARVRRPRHRRAARHGRDRRPARQGIWSRSV